MRIISFVLLTCIMVSCAAQTTVRKADDDEILAERIDLYWQTKQKNNMDAVRTFIDPDLRAEIVAYLDSRKGKPSMTELTSYLVEEVKREGGSATVSTRLTLRIMHPLLGSPQIIVQKVKDIWVKKGDSWYIEMVKPDLLNVLKKYSKEEKEVIGTEKERNKGKD